MNGKTTIKKQISNNFRENGGLLQKKATIDRTEDGTRGMFSQEGKGKGFCSAVDI